jgi:hypothetical protein
MPVQTQESPAANPKFKEKRRGNRMNSRVPVRLEWGAGEKRVSAEAHTRIVNHYGCMVILQHDLDLDQPVALTNLAMEASNAAVIVWKSEPRPEGGWEYGVELVAPAIDFWGLEI